MPKVNKIFLGDKQVRSVIPPYLCFTANTAGSTVALNKTGSPNSVTLETSTDGENWSTYSFGTTITLSNIGDKVYWRNTSETVTGFSKGGDRYSFSMTGSIAGSGDVNYLLSKNSTTVTVGTYCFYRLFENCTALTSSPELPATTLTEKCYHQMFYYCSGLVTPPKLPATSLATSCYDNIFTYCTNLETLIELPATTLASACYNGMFRGCSKIKVSTTQTGEYQTPYRIPTEGTGTVGSDSLNRMFYYTGGTFTGTPSINTTYYTSNTVV